MTRTIVSLVCAVLIAGCRRGDDDGERTARPAATQARDTAAAERGPVFPEAEAIAVLRAVSDAEIARAQVARDVSQSDAVIAYAGVVNADYRGIAQLLDSITAATGQTPSENALSAQLRAEGDSIERGLRSLPIGFNNTFIEEQVKAHSRALQLMDTALIPSARSPQLKNLFQAIRPTIAAHLQRATQILGDRRRAAAERGEPWVSGFAAVPPAPAPAEPAPAEEGPEPEPRLIRPPARDTTTPADTITSASDRSWFIGLPSCFTQIRTLTARATVSRSTGRLT